MKRSLPAFLALLLSFVLVLCACQPNSGEEETTPKIESYAGFSNIPDLGALAGAESRTALAEKAAERLSVEPENVFVYSLGDVSAEELEAWTAELKTRGFEETGELSEDGNSAIWYSDDRKIGLVAGYMDTDEEEGDDAFGVFLVDKSRQKKYVNLDFDSIQQSWSNANSGASFFIDNKKIFGFGYVGSDEGFLSKNTDSSDELLLVEGESPAYVHEWDNIVYAVLPGRLVAVDTKEKDPEEAVQTLREGTFTSLQIVNEKLWYTTKKGLYYCDFDGENTVHVVSGKMKDAFLVGDKVFYLDPSDDNKAHVLSLLTEADTCLTDESVESFFLGSRNYAYYIAEREAVEETADEEEADAEEAADETAEETSEEVSEDASDEELPTTYYALIRLSLKDGEKEELATVREGTSLAGIENRVYYVSDEHEGQIYSVPKKGGTPKRVTRDKDCQKLMTFHDMILYYDYDDETAEDLEHIYISTTDGFMKSDILR